MARILGLRSVTFLFVDTYTVEVDHTDRTRSPDGRFVIHTHIVEVAADNEVEADLLAAQFVIARRHPRVGGMVVATRIVDVLL